MPVCSNQSAAESAAPSNCSAAGRHIRRRARYARLTAAVAFTLLMACGAIAAAPAATLELKTTAFSPGGMIPPQFTCGGANISPRLTWNNPPPHTQSFAMIVDDPDAPAGTWVHWVLYDLPASARSLPEHVAPGDTIAGGGRQGVNDFSSTSYGGPCPPPGKPHRYFFRLYALDTKLDIHPPARRQEVDAAIRGHVLAQAELMGTYGR